MVVKADHERIKTLLKDTITLLCRNGLNFKTEFSVEALIGITLDKEDVVLVSINEIIRAELGSQLTLAKDVDERNVSLRSLDHEDSSESQPGTPVSTNGHRYRKRKLSSGQGSQRDMPEDGQEPDSGDDEGRPFEKAGSGSVLGEESNSEPANKRSMDDSNMAGTRIKDDDTKDVIYIKEEIDTGDWPDGSHTQDSFADPNIPAPSGSDQQHDDNFDFLHGSSLVPVSSDSSVQPSWGDVSHSASSGLIISPSKRSSTATGVGTQGEHSQQVSPYRYGLSADVLPSISSTKRSKQRDGFQCPQCYKVLRTLQGLHYHIDLHRGIYRYKCTYCSKGFSSLTTYKGHVNVYHRERQEELGAVSRYDCPFDGCNKSYPYIQSLRNHIVNTHRANPAIYVPYKTDSQHSPIRNRADPEGVAMPGEREQCEDDPSDTMSGSYCGIDLTHRAPSCGKVAFPGCDNLDSEESAPSGIQSCDARHGDDDTDMKQPSFDEKFQ